MCISPLGNNISLLVSCPVSLDGRGLALPPSNFGQIMAPSFYILILYFKNSYHQRIADLQEQLAIDPGQADVFVTLVIIRISQK